MFLSKLAPKNEPESAEEQLDRSWWEYGLKLFLRITGWQVIPLVSALVIGQWLDERNNSAPTLLLLSAGIAFGFTLFGIILETIRFMAIIKREEEKLAKNKDNKKDVNSTGFQQPNQK